MKVSKEHTLVGPENKTNYYADYMPLKLRRKFVDNFSYDDVPWYIESDNYREDKIWNE